MISGLMLPIAAYCSFKLSFNIKVVGEQQVTSAAKHICLFDSQKVFQLDFCRFFSI